MPAFLGAILRNLIVAAFFAIVSAILYRPPKTEPPEPQDQDFKPTAKEGTEVRELFGTGPVRLMVVAVMDRKAVPIKVG